MDLILGIPRRMLGSRAFILVISLSFGITDILSIQIFVRRWANDPKMLGSLTVCCARGLPFGFLLHARVVLGANHVPMGQTIVPEQTAFTCPEFNTRLGIAAITFLLPVKVICLECFA